MSLVAEKQTRQFNPTLGSSHEDVWKNCEIARGFLNMEAIWSEGDYPHQGNPSQVLRLLVLSAERSAPVPNEEVSAMAVSHGETAGRASSDSWGREGEMKSSAHQQLKRLFTLPEAAEYLGRSTWSVRRLIWEGELRQVRCGRRVHVDIQDMETFIEKHKVQMA